MSKGWFAIGLVVGAVIILGGGWMLFMVFNTPMM